MTPSGVQLQGPPPIREVAQEFQIGLHGREQKHPTQTGATPGPIFAPASLFIAGSQEPGKALQTWERVIDGAHATIKVRQP
jgi:hypothetical protein